MSKSKLEQALAIEADIIDIQEAIAYMHRNVHTNIRVTVDNIEVEIELSWAVLKHMTEAMESQIRLLRNKLCYMEVE